MKFISLKPKNYYLITLSCISIGLNSLPFSTMAENTDKDWISKYNCSKRYNYLCDGYYKEPNFPFPLDTDTKNLPIEITSDSADLISKGTSTFTGNVIAKQGNTTIYADKAIVTHNEKTGDLESIVAIGKVSMTDPGTRIDGTKSESFINTDKKIIYNASYRLYPQHARGDSKSITIYDNNKKMYMPKSSYTTCQPGNDAWKLKSSNTKFDKESGRGEAWNSVLYLENLPVFYWPYINFPIDKRRKTGFLFPSFEHNSINGDTLTAPYYFNIKENYDATINPIYMSKRGYKFNNNFRYLTEHSTGAVTFDYIGKDRGYIDFYRQNKNQNMTALKRSRLRNIKHRYRYGFKNVTRFNNNTSLDLDYLKLGDDNYLYDYGKNLEQTAVVVNKNNKNSTIRSQQNLQTTSTQALQKASLQHNNSLGNLTINYQQYQTLYPVLVNGSNEQLRKLPEISFSSKNYALPLDLSTDYFINYTQFRNRHNSLITNPLNSGDRLYFSPGIKYEHSTPAFYFSPRVRLIYLNYSKIKINNIQKANGVRENSFSWSIPIYAIKSNLNFERELNIKNTEYMQTLSPNIYALYVPYKNQSSFPVFDSGVHNFDYNQLYRENRYSGLDRVSEARQVTFGLSSRLYLTDTGEERLMMGISRARLFRTRISRLNENIKKHKAWSMWAGTIKYNFDKYLTGYLNAAVGESKKSHGNFYMQYKPSDYSVANFGLQLNRAQTNNKTLIKQISTSFAAEINPNVRALGKFNRNLTKNRQLSTLFGLEFHGCCGVVKTFVSRSYLSKNKYEQKINLQLILKGFTSVGNVNNNYLSSVIPGYNPGDRLDQE